MNPTPSQPERPEPPITLEQFKQLGRELEGCYYVETSTDDREEAKRAHDRSLEIEKIIGAAPFEYDGDGNPIATRTPVAGEPEPERIECALCGKSHERKGNNWATMPWDFDHTVIRLDSGTYGQPQQDETMQFHLCPDCFRHKLRPWIEEQKAPTPPADKDAEITALREENKNLRGQYESMKLTTEVATGEHRELSKRLVKDNEARMKAESSLLAANQRIEALEGALRSTAHAENCPWQENAAICENCRELQHDQIDRICLTCGMATLIPTESPACTCHKSALAHAAEVGKETNEN